MELTQLAWLKQEATDAKIFKDATLKANEEVKKLVKEATDA